jgi:hypothetical protein
MLPTRGEAPKEKRCFDGRSLESRAGHVSTARAPPHEGVQRRLEVDEREHGATLETRSGPLHDLRRGANGPALVRLHGPFCSA